MESKEDTGGVRGEVGARERATPSSTYQVHGEQVRRTLRRFGVREADLDDLCHEVFIIVHAQREQLAGVDNVPYWLRAICWRVAAGYRRRAHHRREVAVGALPEAPDEVAGTTHEEIERLHDRTRLLDALDLLDDSQRELIALHDLGDLPITELARLVGCDRKTAQKRLTMAHRQLAAVLRGELAARAAGQPASQRAEPSALVPASAWLSDRLQVIDITPDMNVGRIGNVLLTVWSRSASLEAMERLWDHISDLLETCGGRFTYLATVDAVLRPPEAEARRKIVEILKTFGPFFDAYGTALEGRTSRIVQPVMTGLAMLTRPQFPMRFLLGVPAAAEWIAPHTQGPGGPLAPNAIATAIGHLRRLES